MEKNPRRALIRPSGKKDCVAFLKCVDLWELGWMIRVIEKHGPAFLARDIKDGRFGLTERSGTPLDSGESCRN